MSWTNEQVELLKQLWNEGYSASQIADQIGTVTRNAVIGKIHRLGLQGRRKAIPQPKTAATHPRPEKHPGRIMAGSMSAPLTFRNAETMATGIPAIARETIALAEAAGLPSLPEHAPAPFNSSSPLKLENLKASSCRWPEGDPGTPEFRFCGAHAPVGQSYCPYHTRIAYQSVQQRRKINREVPRIAVRAYA